MGKVGVGAGQRCPYSVLGVSRTASVPDIKTAFRKLALQHHPDKGGDADVFQLVTEANEILTDPAKRRSYDAEVEAQERRRKSGGAPRGVNAAQFEAEEKDMMADILKRDEQFRERARKEAKGASQNRKDFHNWVKEQAQEMTGEKSDAYYQKEFERRQEERQAKLEQERRRERLNQIEEDLQMHREQERLRREENEARERNRESQHAVDREAVISKLAEEEERFKEAAEAIEAKWAKRHMEARARAARVYSEEIGKW